MSEYRIQKLRAALEKIENLGAENPNANLTDQMFRLANDALVADDATQQCALRTDCTCTIPDYRPDRDGFELCSNCGGTRRR